MDRIQFDKRAANTQRDEVADDLWLGAEAMVAPAGLGEVMEDTRAAATERDVDPSWCVI